MKIWWQSPLALCACLSHHNHHEVSRMSSWFCRSIPIGSVQSSHSVMSNSLRPQGLQHTRLPCPSPTPELAIKMPKSMVLEGHSPTGFYWHQLSPGSSWCWRCVIILESLLCSWRKFFGVYLYTYIFTIPLYFNIWISWTSLVVQWLGVCLSTQRTQIQSLSEEDSTCRWATKPVSCICWAHVPCSAIREANTP